MTRRFPLWLLACACLNPLPAAPPVSVMKSQTPVIILAFSKTDGQTGSGTGSGLFVSTQHIVTNWHVCCKLPEGVSAQLLLAGRSKDDLQKATVLWASQEKDLAIIRLEKPVQVTPVTFARSPSLSEGMDVWAVGYPGAAGRMARAEGFFRSSLTKGVISKMDTRAVAGGGHVQLIQTDASINAGNSGGPLFDSCGRVIGVNVTKALITVLDAQGNPVRVPEADGIGWSVDIRELLPELDRQSIRYEAFDTVCQDAAPPPAGDRYSSFVLAAQVALLLVTVVVGAIIVRKKVAPAIVTAVTTRRYPQAPPPPRPMVPSVPPQPAPPQAAAPPPAAPPAAAPPAIRPRVTLIGLTGEYAGQRLPLLAQGLTFGRDAAVANILFATGTPGISKRHCRVYFDRGQVFVEDTYSSHGTFLGSGERLAPGQPRELHSGDEVRLADGGNSFRMERA
ncbi:MAG: trypsin-like peptidase domain-containing protein [Bryobacterales bacterium]|nr:trypsin-like peptidase domain-containing protein [Bryobacterales bacterium]